jgi:glycosyltransferase involved in cell wall biosynthesis
LTGFPNYPGGKLYPGYRVRFRQRENLKDVPVLRVPLYPSHDRSALRRAVNYSSFALAAAWPLLLGWRPDVVYVYNLPSLGFIAALNRRLRKIPFVLDVMDLWPDSVMHADMGARLAWPIRKVCELVYRCAARITVLSPGFKRMLVERGVPGDKIEVIYNWCDEEELLSAPTAAPTKEDLGLADRFNILFAGTMGTVQNLDAVLRAAARVNRRRPRLQFVFMGGGTEIQRLRELAKQIAPLNTLFIPRCSPSEAGAILRLADVLLVHLEDTPLFRVTIPSKVQAYMAIGKPILIGVRGDAAELVVNSKAGLACTPGDSEAIARTALQMADMSEDTLAVMGRAGAERYRRDLSLTAGVSRFESVFREVAA